MLKDKTILITGAASGLGKAWSKNFFEEGARVFACDINEEGLTELKDLGIDTQVVDVSSAAHVQSFIESAITDTGKIDVLFNNAGMGFGHKLDSFPDGAFEHHVSVHLFGTVYGMRYALPLMQRQGYGRIINTISRNAETNVEKTSAYSAAKAAIWSATRVAANENIDHNILINMIIPGQPIPIFGERICRIFKVQKIPILRLDYWLALRKAGLQEKFIGTRKNILCSTRKIQS